MRALVGISTISVVCSASIALYAAAQLATIGIIETGPLFEIMVVLPAVVAIHYRTQFALNPEITISFVISKSARQQRSRGLRLEQADRPERETSTSAYREFPYTLNR
nr:hypothetical protein [uncultured Rhodococcus sp.]